MQPNLHNARRDGHHFDIAAVRLNVRAHQIHDGANPRQQCIAAATVTARFTSVGS